jgi:4-hydroxy-tetrahydrodipicolinate synthase
LLQAFGALRVVAYEDGFLDAPARFVQRIAAVREPLAPSGPLRLPLAARLVRMLFYRFDCGHDLFQRPLTGSIVALVTPMHEDGSVDYPTLRKLIDWHIAEGTDCIGVVGTTGESPTVNVEEHCEIIRVSVEQAAGACPSWPAAAPTPPPKPSSWPSYAKKVGADSQLQVVPYYNKPTQEGQYQHFKAIAEAVGDLPMVLYNVPGRSVADMQHDTVLRLAQVPGIVGIKEATGNIERAQWLIRDVPKGFAVYSGDDPTAVALMLCGGQGNISVTANVAPRLMHELCVAAIAAGDAARHGHPVR